MTQARRPSPLQRRVLIVLAALDAKRPGPVATRDIERVLEQGGDAPVYGPNLRASCRRMEAAGWLRTLRAPNLQLAVELTEAGRGIAEPLFQAEREAETARQRLTDVRRLPLRQTAAGDAVELQLDDGRWLLVRIVEVSPERIRLKKEDWGDTNATAVYYEVGFPMPATLRVHEGDAFEVDPFA